MPNPEDEKPFNLDAPAPKRPLKSVREHLNELEITVEKVPSAPPPVKQTEKEVDQAIESLTSNLDQLFETLGAVLTPEGESPPQVETPKQKLSSPIAKKQAQWRDSIIVLAQRVKHISERLEI